VNPPVTDGAITGQVLHTPVLPVSLSMGGQPAQVVYAGSTPDNIAGVMQIEAIVPAGAGTGPVPVVLTVGPAASQPGVTINVK
jgi:uncharacterized protein (TIGR03437 family)